MQTGNRASKTTTNRIEGKLPPKSIDAERAVLGALMLSKDALYTALELLKPECFYLESHSILFSAVFEMHSEGTAVDMVTVFDRLRKLKVLEKVGGPLFVSQLADDVASTANTEHHSRIILQKYFQRELIRTSSEVIGMAYDESCDVFDVMDFADKSLGSISQSIVNDREKPLSEIIDSAVKTVRDSVGKKLTGYSTGLPRLDRQTGGLIKGELIIIAARASMGKTALAVQIAKYLGRELYVKVFSLEMTGQSLVTRVVSSDAMIKSDQLKIDVSSSTAERFSEYADKLRPIKLSITDDIVGLRPILTKCRKLHRQGILDVVIIDYMQLVENQTKSGNREQEVSEISRKLKQLANELNIPVIALSQLSRDAEKNAGKRPALSNLRESGAIEQDADQVWFVYRPEYYRIFQDGDGRSTVGKAWIIVDKNRNGKTGDCELLFKKEFTLFKDPDVEESEKKVQQISFTQNDTDDFPF